MSPLFRFPLLHRAASLFALACLCAACASNTTPGGGEVASAGNKTKDSQGGSAPKDAKSAVQLDKAQQELANGVASYENGAYKVASRQLQNALALGLEENASRARAHKYLAFMHCVGGRKVSCRDEFRKAFEADPDFDLSPAEAGHPTWGPVFRKLKASRKPAGK